MGYYLKICSKSYLSLIYSLHGSYLRCPHKHKKSQYLDLNQTSKFGEFEIYSDICDSVCCIFPRPQPLILDDTGSMFYHNQELSSYFTDKNDSNCISGGTGPHAESIGVM